MATTPNDEGYRNPRGFWGRFPKTLIVHSVRSGETLDHLSLSTRIAERTEFISRAMRGDPGRVVIETPDPIRRLVDLFAVWEAGFCAVMVGPDLSGEEKRRVAAKVDPDIWVGPDGDQFLEGEGKPPCWQDAALVLMTSGTTANPKGVTLGLDAIEKRLKLNVAEIGAETLARSLCPLPLYFGHGLIGNCLTPLYAGGSLSILESPDLREVSAFGAMIDKYEIGFLSSVPSLWRMILRLSPPPEVSPRRVHVGSAPLPLSLWDDIRAWCGSDSVFNTYGMTETANWISGGTRPSGDAEGFVGRPWGGRFRVLRDGALRDQGMGEVAVRSPGQMLGLWGESSSEFVADGFMMTGDIGELTDDQNLRLIGRVKNEINKAGIKVLAEEVDMLLERHPDVLEACSFGIPDELSGELVGAVVVEMEGSDLQGSDLIKWCARNARPHAVPHRIEVVEEIEKTDRGKIDRRNTRKQALNRWL